eukprot:CAMPEP_0197257578 /NCGR_PEP_ID=MMETSP1429-20130617/79202_1 /TAXON_ID=49237 /ORGANISM="Chaetoceros  sp., Strain UNC1202" /LENGTH=89 /DNA_ID=CAMNT_0042721463 /DNA_START=172 /DNA_END=441 /DNA_ORIENTATION=+
MTEIKLFKIGHCPQRKESFAMISLRFHNVPTAFVQAEGKGLKRTMYLSEEIPDPICSQDKLFPLIAIGTKSQITPGRKNILLGDKNING